MKTQSGTEKGEDLNVREVHGQLLREKSEPSEIYRAAPGWLKHGIYAPLLIWGLIYMIAASGGFHWNEYNEGPRSTLEMAATGETIVESEPVKAPETAAPPSLAAEGEKVYQTVCIACHQSNGLGLPGAFPPLDGSEWVAGDDKTLSLIVLHGLGGPIEVKGQQWNMVMPPQGFTLDDRQIAAALSYVRSAWSNDYPEVKPETIAAMRSQFEGHAPWTAEALKAEAP